MKSIEFGGVVMEDTRVKSTEELAGDAKIERLEAENDLLRCIVIYLLGAVCIMAVAFIWWRIRVATA